METSPSTTLYTLGSGVLWIAEWAGGSPGEYEDLGNCPSCELELAIEEKEHFASRSQGKSLDKTTIIQRGYNLKFTLDEMATANLKRWAMATQTGSTLHGLMDINKEYAVKFKADNAEGPNRKYEFWKCSIRPDGSLGMIGDDWQSLGYTAKGLADRSNHASSPWFDITATTTTTTTTTTTL